MFHSIAPVKRVIIDCSLTINGAIFHSDNSEENVDPAAR